MMGLFRSRSSQIRHDIDSLRDDIASLASNVRAMRPRQASMGSSLPSLSSIWPGSSSSSSWASSLWPFSSHRDSWTDQAYNRLDDARDAAHYGADAVSRQVDRALWGASEGVRNRPLTAALALLGLGIALGLAARNVQTD